MRCPHCRTVKSNSNTPSHAGPRILPVTVDLTQNPESRCIDSHHARASCLSPSAQAARPPRVPRQRSRGVHTAAPPTATDGHVSRSHHASGDWKKTGASQSSLSDFRWSVFRPGPHGTRMTARARGRGTELPVASLAPRKGRGALIFTYVYMYAHITRTATKREGQHSAIYSAA